MKFSELKNSLKEKVNNAYLLEGDDSYFLERAKDMLCGIVNDFKDFNINLFYENYKIGDVVSAALNFPLMSKNRVVVMTEYYGKTEYKTFLSYIDNPNPGAVLVIVNSKPSDLKSLKNIVYVDCSKEDLITLAKWVPKLVANYSAVISAEAINLLIEYCLFDMARLDTDIKKLASFTKNIDIETVNLMVHKDVDFQVYELTDAICKENNFLALNILESLLEKNDASYISLILVTIFNAFKRMYFIKQSNLSDAEISKLLKIKEYAVKIARRQAAKYSEKFLQNALQTISDFESGFKSGKINAETALKQIIFKLLDKETLNAKL